MGCQAGAGGEAGRADSRAAAPWPPHMPCRRAARRDERRAPPWQLQRAQRALQARRRRMTSGGRRHSATSGCSRWRSARRQPAARRAGTRATRATRASARRGAMQRAGDQPAPCDRHPCVERRGASHAGPPRAAAPQGGQARSERVSGCLHVLAARARPVGRRGAMRRAARSGGHAQAAGVVAAGSPRGLRGAPSILRPAGNGPRPGRWSYGVAQVLKGGFGVVRVGRKWRDQSVPRWMSRVCETAETVFWSCAGPVWS